jgi:hypothetical protein
MSFIGLSPDRPTAARLDVWRNNFPARDLFERGRTQERGDATKIRAKFANGCAALPFGLRCLALWAATS